MATNSKVSTTWPIRVRRGLVTVSALRRTLITIGRSTGVIGTSALRRLDSEDHSLDMLTI